MEIQQIKRFFKLVLHFVFLGLIVLEEAVVQVPFFSVEQQKNIYRTLGEYGLCGKSLPTTEVAFC